MEKLAERIKRIEIQGATNIALASLEAVEKSDGSLEKIRQGIDLLLNTRPTEPLMINTLNALKEVQDAQEVVRLAGKFREQIASGMDKLVKIGARLIKDGMTVQTICHSSTVVKILAQAHEDGRKIKVVNTETRPLYQGRKTARKLYEAGVPVKMYVDSAIHYAMKKEDVDLALVGADAIFVDGSVANKIGTGLLALAAESLDIPFYAAGLSLKLDKGSLWAKSVTMEERDPREIWDYPVNIGNPAFETVPSKRIKGIITELGVLPPATAYLEFAKKQ